jgi:hypothetical protein
MMAPVMVREVTRRAAASKRSHRIIYRCTESSTLRFGPQRRIEFASPNPFASRLWRLCGEPLFSRGNSSVLPVRVDETRVNQGIFELRH